MPIQQINFEGRTPVFTWATKPAANAVPVGYTITIPEFSHSDWYSNGTYWRPVGGRQVLAQRSNNPVTVQSLSGEVAETIGPFPGGLVRAGMRLEMDVTFTHSGIGSGSRFVNLRINDTTFAWTNSTSSGAFLIGRMNGSLNILGDGNTAHLGTMGTGGGSFLVGVGNKLAPVLDFSQPWSSQIQLISAAETAVNISSATWAGGIATFNTSAAHTLAVGDKTVIASVTPSGWNIPDGAIVLSVPTTTQFTVALAADPGTYTSGGTSSRISNMISQSYVLELVG